MLSRIIRPGIAGTLALAMMVLSLGVPARADENRTLQLLNINDFHGRVSQSIGMGLAHTVQTQRAENPNTLLLSAGDNISASLFVSSIQDDEPTLDYLNALGLQGSAVGNHEFDRGLADLQNHIEEHADFPYLGANVIDRATGKPALTPYTVLTTANGTRVGVIGTVTQTTPELTNPADLATVDFTDPVEATNSYAQLLSDGNESNGEADIIVAEYHEGVDTANPSEDPLVSGTDAAVDVIFTGHTHEEYVIDAAVPGEPGRTRPVVQTGNYGDNLGDVELTLDSDNRVVAYTSTLHARAAEPTAEEIAADPVLASVEQILTAANNYAAEQGSKEVTQLNGKITTGWDSAKQDSKGGFDQRNLESTMGHLVADMYLAAAQSTGRTPADIGIVNPGGLRDEFPSGLRFSLAASAKTLTVADVVSVAPFANNLWTTELTGAQLKQVLEEQWQQDASGKMATRPYIQLGFSSNLTYTYSGSADAEGYTQRGSHIQEIYVNGERVDDTDSLTVALPSFLLGGGDNFTTLAQGRNTKDTALVDSAAFIAYLSDLGEVSPRYEKQAVRVENLTSYDTDGSLTFSLSDMNTRSYGAPELTSLDVSIDGKTIGTVAVQSGAATVDLPLTGSGVTAGTHQILLRDTGGSVGTEIRLSATFFETAGNDESLSESAGDSQKSEGAGSVEAAGVAGPLHGSANGPEEGSGSHTGQGARESSEGDETSAGLAHTGFSGAPLVLALIALAAGAATLYRARRLKLYRAGSGSGADRGR